jgi:hypothetical protein
MTVDADMEDQVIARVLLCERAGKIFKKVFGRPAPDGFLGALGRLGGKPMIFPGLYSDLLAIYERPENHRRAEALKYVGAITEKTLRVTKLVDERWCHHKLLTRLEDWRAAYDFNRSIAFAQSVNSKITDDVVREAIARLPAEATLARMVRRWVRRADRFPDQPVVASPQLKSLKTARDLTLASFKFRNCLGSKGIEDAVIGAAAFLEFMHDDKEAILELRPLAGGFGWVLQEIHVLRNGEVADELREAARATCLAECIPHISDGSKCEDWQGYRDFTQKKWGVFL